MDRRGAVEPISGQGLSPAGAATLRASAPHGEVLTEACGCDTPPSMQDWLRIGLGLVLSGQLMVLSLARNVSTMDPASEVRVGAALLALTALGAALLGPDLVRAAREALSRGNVSLEALFSLALAGGLGASLWGLWTGGDVFFEVVTVVLTVHAIGAKLKARFWSDALDRVARHWLPDRAQRVGEAEPVPLSDLRSGDLIALFTGDRAPADGRITEGSGWIDTSSLDGHLVPQSVGPGDAIPGGALWVRGAAHVELVADPQDGAHAVAATALLEAARREPPTSALARRIARAFTPVVSLVAVSAGLAWTWMDGLDMGFRAATAVLLVACPCGLGVATPVALWAAAADLARRGVQVRRLAALEGLAHAGVVVLDKTGTLTTIAPEASWSWSEGVGEDRARWIAGAVAAVERWSDHPVAEALRGAPTHGIVTRRVEAREGGGLEAEVVDGDRVASLVLEPTRPARGLYVHVDGERVARVDLTERVAHNAHDLVDGLHARGLTVRVLTGDTAPIDLGVPCEIGASPAEKAQALRRLREEHGSVVFLGDAANDLVALAEADVSVTFDGARSGVVERVDLQIRDRADLLDAVDGAQRVHRRLKRLLAGSLTANVVGISIAAAGLLHPVVAAIIMSGTSMGVTLAAVPRSGGERNAA